MVAESGPTQPLPWRDPEDVMDRAEFAALEEVLDTSSFDDFVDAPRPD